MTRYYKGRLTGNALTVSGATTELYGNCNTDFGSFKVRLDASVTLNGVTKEYHSPESCTQPAGTPKYVVKQGPGSFSLTIPLDLSAQSAVPSEEPSEKPKPVGSKAPTSTERPGGEQQVFNNNNISGVNNNPSTATTFRTDQPWLVTYVMTYHWNGGRGQTPGGISLRHQDGTSYGPWQTRGRPNQGSQTNLYWECWPNVVIKPGVYTVIDSHPASWAWNAQSRGGIAEIKGIPRPGTSTAR